MTDDIAQLKKLTEELDGSGDITKVPEYPIADFR